MKAKNIELVVDIETTAIPLKNLTETQKEFLFRYANQEKNESSKQEKLDEVIRYLNLYPFTAKIISIGLMNVNSGNRYVLFESEEKKNWEVEAEKIVYEGLSESEMLSKFWEYSNKTNKLITFNGRIFDIPFLISRSAIYKIKPTNNYLKSRYDHTNHIDLLEEFTFHGKMKKFNLDFYCNSFGIESPKTDLENGLEINNLYNSGKIEEIAIYCGKDILATAKLYEIWKKFYNI